MKRDEALRDLIASAEAYMKYHAEKFYEGSPGPTGLRPAIEKAKAALSAAQPEAGPSHAVRTLLREMMACPRRDHCAECADRLQRAVNWMGYESAEAGPSREALMELYEAARKSEEMSAASFDANALRSIALERCRSEAERGAQGEAFVACGETLEDFRCTLRRGHIEDHHDGSKEPEPRACCEATEARVRAECAGVVRAEAEAVRLALGRIGESGRLDSIAGRLAGPDHA